MADAEILGHHVGRRVRHPVGEQHGLVLGEVAIIKHQQEFAAVGSESLDRVGNAGGEKPEIVFFDVGHEALALRIDAGDAGVAIEHEGPFRGGVPMQLADAAGGEPHVHSGQTLGDGKFAQRDFARPATLMKPFVGERKRVLESLHAAGIRGKRIALSPDLPRPEQDWWDLDRSCFDRILGL